MYFYLVYTVEPLLSGPLLSSQTLGGKIVSYTL